MMGSTLESIVRLIFFKYSFKKVVFYFSCSIHDFENNCKDLFKIHKMFLMA